MGSKQGKALHRTIHSLSKRMVLVSGRRPRQEYKTTPIMVYNSSNSE